MVWRRPGPRMHSTGCGMMRRCRPNRRHCRRWRSIPSSGRKRDWVLRMVDPRTIQAPTTSLRSPAPALRTPSAVRPAPPPTTSPATVASGPRSADGLTPAKKPATASPIAPPLTATKSSPPVGPPALNRATPAPTRAATPVNQRVPIKAPSAPSLAKSTYAVQPPVLLPPKVNPQPSPMMTRQSELRSSPAPLTPLTVKESFMAPPVPSLHGVAPTPRSPSPSLLPSRTSPEEPDQPELTPPRPFQWPAVPSLSKSLPLPPPATVLPIGQRPSSPPVASSLDQSGSQALSSSPPLSGASKTQRPARLPSLTQLPGGRSKTFFFGRTR